MPPPHTPLLRRRLVIVAYGTGFVGTYAFMWEKNPRDRASLNMVVSVCWPTMVPLTAVMYALAKLDTVLEKW